MGSVFPGPVELAEAAAEGLDLVLVGVLLALSQFNGFEDFLHVVERGAKGLDAVVDLLDGVGDGGWGGGLKVASWRRGRSFACGRGGRFDRLTRLGEFLGRCARRRGGGQGCSPPTAPMAATAASATAGALRG